MKYIYIGPFEILFNKVFEGKHENGNFFILVDDVWVDAIESEWKIY